MTFAAAIFLIAAGAILRYAVTADVSWLDLHTVGVILMAVGIFGLLLGLFLNLRDQDPARRPV
jgi:hypothetical protein